VKRPGDENLYQACVLTCRSDACNSSAGVRSAALLVAMATGVVWLRWLAAAR